MADASSLRLKITMLNSNDVMKIMVPVDSTVQQLHERACEKFQLESSQFVLQYMDEDFREYINVTSMTEVTDLMSLRLCSKNSLQPTSSNGSPTAAYGGYVRQERWPERFPVPEFDADVKIYLNGVEGMYAASGNTAVVPRDIKGKMLDAIANKIYGYTAYATTEQVKQVAQALTEKYPSLQCRTAPQGWEAWAHSISFKMGNFRSKLRKLGCDEVNMNGGKRSKVRRPDAPPPAANIKKARKGELNFQPNLPSSETTDSLEYYREQMAVEMNKMEPDWSMVNRHMALTFSARRKEVNSMALIQTVKNRWPALFSAAQLRLEFTRLTNTRLDDMFQELDCIGDQLFQLLSAKKGKYSDRIRRELAAFEENKENDGCFVVKKRSVLCRLLPVLLDEDPACLYRTFEDDIVDLTENHPPHIAVTVNTDAYLVVAEQSIVLASADFASAVADFLAVIYAMNLEYPSKGKRTYEFIQSVLLKLGTKKLSPKVLSLREKLVHADN